MVDAVPNTPSGVDAIGANAAADQPVEQNCARLAYAAWFMACLFAYALWGRMTTIQHSVLESHSRIAYMQAMGDLSQQKPLIVADGHGQIVTLNSDAARMFGYEGEEETLNQRPLVSLFPGLKEGGESKIDRIIKESLAAPGGQSRAMTVYGAQGLNKDGEKLKLTVSARAVAYQHGDHQDVVLLIFPSPET